MVNLRLLYTFRSLVSHVQCYFYSKFKVVHLLSKINIETLNASGTAFVRRVINGHANTMGDAGGLSTVSIPRDYTRGTVCRFSEEFPQELTGHVSGVAVVFWAQ